MSQKKRLIIMAGGTGGHVFPGLAVARYLINQGWEIRWLGTKEHMEADLVKKNNIEIDFIRISGFRGKNIKKMLLALFRIFRALRKARKVMKRFNPDVVLGMGGYVSGPGGLAACSLGIPLVLHEQNSVAGLTNKWLAKIATKVIQAFPGAFPNAKVVGNPIHINILKLPLPQKRLISRKGTIRVLVIGGSQGAYILNQVMPKVAEKLSNIIIWHQSGKYMQKIVKEHYISLGQTQHKVSGFIDDMAEAYSWADVVICRSGGLTVSEIAVAGLPAVFVPFQHKDRQQYRNALFLEEVGAAKIFEQKEFTVDAVISTLITWNRKRLFNMAKRAREVAILDATEQVANEVNLITKI